MAKRPPIKGPVTYTPSQYLGDWARIKNSDGLVVAIVMSDEVELFVTAYNEKLERDDAK